MKICAVILALVLYQPTSRAELPEACQAAATRSHACCQKPDLCEFPKQAELKSRIENLETEFAATARLSGPMNSLEVQIHKARELRRALAAAKVERQELIAQTCLNLAKACTQSCAKYKSACGQDLAVAKSLRDEAQNAAVENP